MSRQFIIIGLIVVLVTGALGGMGALALWQLQPDNGGVVALVKALSFGRAVIEDDPDRDGLSNEDEEFWGTSLSNPDTDGDGYSDKAEVEANYNPLVAAPDTNKLPVGFVPGRVSSPAQAYLVAVDNFRTAVDGLALSNQDMLKLATTDWLARKDEDEKKKYEDEKLRLLKAILVAVGGQVPEEPVEDPVKCGKDHKDKCTAFLLVAMHKNIENKLNQVKNTSAPVEAQHLHALVVRYGERALEILDNIIDAEHKRDKEKAVKAFDDLRKLEETDYDLIVGELSSVRSKLVQKEEEKPRYNFLNPLRR